MCPKLVRRFETGKFATVGADITGEAIRVQINPNLPAIAYSNEDPLELIPSPGDPRWRCAAQP
jgi:hypothetical protein